MAEPANAARPAPTPIVRTIDGAPAVLVGDRTVVTAEQADAANSFEIGARVAAGAADLYLIEAATGGSACPVRYVLLEIPRDGRDPRATPAFGTCANRARLTFVKNRAIVTMQGFSNVGDPGPARTYTYDENRMIEDTVPPTSASRDVVGYTPTFRCAGIASQEQADAMLAAFETEYPPALVDPARVDGAVLDASTLQRIVADLACLAAQPGADAFVPDQAAALFASRRHGRSAFEALDALAQRGDARAKRFAMQMRAYAEQG